MDDVQSALKKKFSNLHPLIIQRSLTRSRSNGELFDILSTVPPEYPVIWDEAERRWVRTNDMLQGNSRRR